MKIMLPSRWKFLWTLVLSLLVLTVNAQVSIVKDIEAGTSSGLSSYSYFVQGGTVAYFVGYTSAAGNELWKTDGTSSGTVLVKDVYPGSNSSNIRSMFFMGGTLYFVANNGTNGEELWRSDGTAAGTYLVKDIYAGANSGISTYSFFATVGSSFYFSADNGSTGYELWKSDGTSAGTVLVKDINAGAASSFQGFVTYATVMGSTLYFTATTSAQGEELWKSDGTAAGTVLVKDVYAGTTTSNITYLTNNGTKLFFTANNGTTGTELWTSDGSTAGTVLVKDIYSGATSSSPTGLTIFGGLIYFQATDAANGSELWKSDGTGAGTVLVKDIYAGSTGSNPYAFYVFGSSLYMIASTATAGAELWKTDGTSGGTVMVKDIQPGSLSSSPAGFTAGGSVFYFTAYTSANGTELWKSDGTSAGTVMVRDIAPGTNSSSPQSMAYLNGVLYFAAELQFQYGTFGYEPYKSDGTSAGTLMLDNMMNGNSDARSFFYLNSHVLFAATKATTGMELYEYTSGYHKKTYFFAVDTVLYTNSPFNKTNFIDYTPNDPSAWQWTFTGATPSSSTTQNPTAVTYSSPGTYSVTLSTTFPTGPVSETKTGYIKVYDINSRYCSVYNSGTTGSFYINGVSLGSINNQNTGSASGPTYTYYSSISTTLNQGQTYTLTIDGRGGSPASYAAWIDYDRNGLFDATELLDQVDGSWNANNIRTITFTVPNITYVGTTRMRVMAAEALFNSSWRDLEPCGNGSWQDGEAEDYVINMAGGLAPVANFSANSTTINSGQSVNFTDASTNTPTSWSWSFTGGTPSTSTAQNPTNITYATPGCYQVTLTATNQYGSDQEVKTCYINVLNQALAPVADFSASQTTIGNGLPISFTDLTTNNPASWSWNFTGATPATSTAQNPTNIIYNTGGTYTVALTASNSNGSNTKTKTNYITVVDYCMPFTAGQTTGGDYISGVNILSLPNGGIILNNQNTGSATGPVFKDYTNMVGTVKRDSSYSIGVDASTGGGDIVVWIDFNRDGDWSDAGEKVGEYQTTTGTWGQYANFTVTIPSTALLGKTRMRVRYNAPMGPGMLPCVNYTDGEIEDYTVNITQHTSCTSAPVANFTPASTTIAPGGTVNFTSTSTNSPTSYSWSFTGGTPSTSTVQNPTGVSFTTAGCHQVSLTATNACGSNTKTVSCAVTVSSTTTGYCAITTSSTGTADGDYIDGVSLGTINNMNTGSVSGPFYTDYTAMSTNLNRSAVYSLSIKAGQWISGYPDYYAAWIDYNKDGDFLDANEKLGEFLSTSPGATQSISFTVPAAASLGSTRMRVRGVWTTTPPVDPCLTYSYGETEDYSVNISSSTGAAPVANFSANNTNIAVGATVSFTDMSTNSPTSWSWSFTGGTPSTSTAQNPSGITYSSPGCYTVTLTATNASGSDGETKTCFINVGTASSCDSLKNYSATNNMVIYTNTTGGYIAGHNSYGDVAKADKFSGYTAGNKITGAYLKFGVAKYSTTAKTISVKVWDASGTGGTPGTVLATKTVTIASIASNVTANAMTYVGFTTPVSVSGPFYLGIEFAYAAGDTVALVTNTDGQTNPGTAWEKWSDNTWHPYSDASNSWGVNVAHIIKPVLCPTVTSQLAIDDEEYLNIYPNPGDGVFNLVKTGKSRSLKMTVVNSIGQVILEKQLTEPDGEFREQIDLQKNGSGIYFMILSSGTSTVTRRIVISK